MSATLELSKDSASVNRQVWPAGVVVPAAGAGWVELQVAIRALGRERTATSVRAWGRRTVHRAVKMRQYARVPQFPSIKAKALLAVLLREPLGYEIVRQKGSHRHLEAKGRPRVLFSFHDNATVAPGLVRKILVGTVGLSAEEALKLL